MPSLVRPYVIAADNNEFYRQVLGDHFRGLSFDVSVAGDGLEALELLERRTPDMMVLDLIMPRIDGGRLCSFVRSQERWSQVPILILSGLLPDEIDGVESIPADGWIAKMPLDLLTEALRTATSTLMCGRRPGERLMIGFEKMYRREVVLELLQERRTRREILESLSEGIAELSIDRRILSANGAFERMTGSTPGELTARTLDEIFPDSSAILGALFSELDAGHDVSLAELRQGALHLKVKLHRLDIGTRSDEGVGRAIGAAQATTEKVKLQSMMGTVGYTLLLEDISQKVRAETERRLMEERLARSDRMSALSLFVAGAAHELNNPLTGVLGYAQLASQRADDPADRLDLERIAEGVQRCRAILSHMMAFARSIRPQRTLTGLNEVVRDATQAMADRLARGGVTLEMDLNPSIPDLRLDRARLKDAFVEVMANAIKAMEGLPRGRELRITTGHAAGRVEVEFADSGPGIPAAELRRIFDPFFTTREVGQGKGLGLSVAWGAVSAHGGRIEAANRTEGGTTVRISMPEVDPDETDPRIAPPRGEARPPLGPAQKRILIVDDQGGVQRALVDLLENLDCPIDTAASGLEGLRRIQEADYDLILIDMRMPDMTGEQIYQDLSRLRPPAAGRLIFISDQALSPEAEAFLSRSGRPCLSHPFSPQSVIEAARLVMDRDPSA